jgi:hypothetical protein
LVAVTTVTEVGVAMPSIATGGAGGDIGGLAATGVSESPQPAISSIEIPKETAQSVRTSAETFVMGETSGAYKSAF